ncbi:MAG: cupin domain-containing protein [Pseudomonadota bacterium]
MKQLLLLFLALSATSTNAEEFNATPFGITGLQAAIDALPKKADKVIIDKRLYDGDTFGIRVFRLYKTVPAHYHQYSDNTLYLLDGEIKISINEEQPQLVKPGEALYWRRNIPHGVTKLLTPYATVLAVDAPKRDPADVVFLDKPVEFLE